MVDATGMCGACRVSVGGKTKFVCVDGPEFDGHEVDFKELVMRNRAYLKEEKEAMDKFLKEEKEAMDKLLHKGGKCMESTAPPMGKRPGPRDRQS
jgi:hypothetical protein